MNTFTLTLNRFGWGWAVMLSDGTQLARFTGPGSKRRALRYVAAAGRPGVRAITRAGVSGTEGKAQTK